VDPRARRRTGAYAPALLATVLTVLFLAGCGATPPWARGTGSVGPYEDGRRAAYEVSCTECRVSYAVPDEGRRHRKVSDGWEQAFLAPAGSMLSVDVTATEVVAIRAATVEIRVRGEVVDADTLWRSSDRRTIAASHLVGGGAAPRVSDGR